MCADNVEFSGGANSSFVTSCLLPPYPSPRSQQVHVDVLRKAFTAPQRRAAVSHSKSVLCTSHNRQVLRTMITDNALEQQQQ